MQIENNTVRNTKPQISYIYFTMNFEADGIQEVIIKNNRFENVQYISPGFFKCIKVGTDNAKFTFTNNYFSNVANVINSFALALLYAPVI
jgi:hypothetical protein